MGLLVLPYGKKELQGVQLNYKPKPRFRSAWFINPQRETARHEYFSLWSRWETFAGGRKTAAHGELFVYKSIMKRIR